MTTTIGIPSLNNGVAPSLATMAIQENGKLLLDKERSQLSVLDESIEELEKQLHSLRLKRTALANVLNAYKYPVLSLPNEVTSEIFIRTLQDDGYFPSLFDRDAPMSLLQICAQWRAIALATPALWRAVELRKDDIEQRVPTAESARMLRTWIERSRSLPISLNFRFEPQMEEVREIVPTIVRYRTRWEYLELDVVDADVPRISGSLPQLKQLHLTGWEDFTATSHPAQHPPTPSIRRDGTRKMPLGFEQAALSLCLAD